MSQNGWRDDAKAYYERQDRIDREIRSDPREDMTYAQLVAYYLKEGKSLRKAQLLATAYLRGEG